MYTCTCTWGLITTVNVPSITPQISPPTLSSSPPHSPPSGTGASYTVARHKGPIVEEVEEVNIGDDLTGNGNDNAYSESKVNRAERMGRGRVNGVEGSD